MTLLKGKITEYPNRVTANPKVSICLITYNHAPFIKQCIEGVLNQDATFDYELIIGEDQSSDGTREVCQEYADRFPDKIRLFLNSRSNNLQVGGVPTGNINFFYTVKQARGDYIAFLEGDDYWIDMSKLRIQYEFLHVNPNFSFAHSNSRIQHSTTNKLGKPIHRNSKGFNGNIFKKLLIDNFIITNTVMARRDIVFHAIEELQLPNIKWLMGDYPLWLYMAGKEDVHYDKRCFGVYRRHMHSITSQASGYNQRKLMIDSKYMVQKVFVNMFLKGEDRTRLRREILEDYLKNNARLCFVFGDFNRFKTCFNRLNKLNGFLRVQLGLHVSYLIMAFGVRPIYLFFKNMLASFRIV